MTFYKVFIATLFTFNLSANAQTTLDIDQLNLTLKDVVQEHIDTFDFLESGSVVVDKNKTDLAQGSLSLGFNFESTELNLQGAIAPQNMGLVGQLDVTTSTLGVQKKVDFQASIELVGNTLSILKHVNSSFADCSVVDPVDVYQVQLCNYVTEVQNASSASELSGALHSLRMALLEIIPNFTSNADLIALLQEITILEDVASTIVSSMVVNTALFNLVIDADLTLTFANDRISLLAKGSTTLSESDYQSFVGTLEQTLIGVQTKDPDTLSMVYNYTFLVFDLLEGIFF